MKMVIENVASILTDGDERISLSIAQDKEGFKILDEKGENAGQYAFASKEKALDALQIMWGCWPWDLQYNT